MMQLAAAYLCSFASSMSIHELEPEVKERCAEAASAVVLQGHFQIALNRERCPLLQKRLSVGMRILYMSGVWSYIVGLTSTPTFIVIPLVNASTFVNYHACCCGLQSSKTLLQCMLQVQHRMQELYCHYCYSGKHLLVGSRS